MVASSAKADREQIGGAFSDIVEDPPPLFYGADDGGEVVIGDDHIRGLFGDLWCPSCPWLRRYRQQSEQGASFTPSPVMATIWPLAFRASTMRTLCSAVTLGKY